MRQIINSSISLYLKHRFKVIRQFMDNPYETQERIFRDLIARGSLTEWGKSFNYSGIQNFSDFQKNVPISHYDDLKSYIHRMMLGEKDILWPGKITWFSKSSGTTSDKSKFIPVSAENLKNSHYKSSWDVLTLLYNVKPDANIFGGKNLAMGGTVGRFDEYPETMVGDISGIMIKNAPEIGRLAMSPDAETALIADWNVKLEQMATITGKENIMSVSGVPTWAIVLFRKMMDMYGKSNMLEIWPNAEVYLHGGVAFDPYRAQFRDFFPSDNFTYLEIYNASEGYFGIQNDLSVQDMLLLLDNEIFYEFIPFDQIHDESPDVLTLRDVELNKNYVLVISTNSGLWRYVVGDTISFTDLEPFKIRITGRIKHFINVFGEEVMVSNTDKAVALTCEKHHAKIEDYTVAPVFFKNQDQGGHQWLVEFSKKPHDLVAFARDLDLNLQQINSDYEAKRFNNLALKELELVSLPQGTFYNWMQSRGKLGGQNKVPRLSNSRQYVDEILKFHNDEHGK